MDAGLIAAAAGAGGVVVSKLIDLAVAKSKSKPAELSLMSRRLDSVDSGILQQRQQFDEATAKFRAELQTQITELQKEKDDLLEDIKKLRSENIAFTFKIAELEYKLRISDGTAGLTPSTITTEITTATTVSKVEDEAHRP